MGFLKHFRACVDDCPDCKPSPCDPCCPGFSVTYRSRSASRTKCGHPEFGTPSSPPKIYYNKTQSGGINQASGSGTTQEDTYNTWSGTHSFAIFTCSETDDRQVVIRRVLGSDVGGPCDDSQTTTGFPGQADAYGEWAAVDNGCALLQLTTNCNPGSAASVDSCCVAGSGTVVSPTVKTFADPANCGLGGVSGSVVTVTLSSEYTTVQLQADVGSAVLAATWGSFSGTQDSAFWENSVDELTSDIRQSEFKVTLDFAAPAGCKLEYDVFDNGVFFAHNCIDLTAGATEHSDVLTPLAPGYSFTVGNFAITSGSC